MFPCLAERPSYSPWQSATTTTEESLEQTALFKKSTGFTCTGGQLINKKESNALVSSYNMLPHSQAKSKK